MATRTHAPKFNKSGGINSQWVRQTQSRQQLAEEALALVTDVAETNTEKRLQKAAFAGDCTDSTRRYYAGVEQPQCSKLTTKGSIMCAKAWLGGQVNAIKSTITQVGAVQNAAGLGGCLQMTVTSPLLTCLHFLVCISRIWYIIQKNFE